ncbi:CaiB/BaiF CoA transferase family protein [Pigmentiphaga kullae]|uniref:Crotonobetainyl-CoA:carnitine CoA-transferase CaiB-like acyl-CoA transferase n=1 Tax=Pigmentiphaga kullae TaxID=151784 RepID=A0A4V2F3M4_9BURK|nr:CoA transferase [Pigmentiphaga kullae]RZS84617.1 crotonobetainyl-CoA:carnitine CoA-transferase CaiB-like acyl-CoA transferase [Pigmentiphaga kullae]
MDATRTAEQGPLAGVRVVDLSTVVVGPACTLALADHGAEVIKVEAPDGDLMRQLGGGARHRGMTGKFMNFNRNKRSVCIDLKTEGGRAVLRRLLEGADVFVTNMRTSALDKLGLDWESLRAVNPRLIHCLVLAFGRKGRYAGRPAYDTVIQSASGVAGAFQASGGEPRFVPFVMTDHITGQIAAQAIGFALYRRTRTGVGESIEVPMFETMAAFVMREHMGNLTFDPPIGPVGDARILNADNRPVPTKDGYIAISPNTDAQAFAFFEAIGRPELKTDPRFCSVAARTANSLDYYALRASALRGRTSAEWLEILERIDVPAMRYNTLESLLDDPHLEDAGFVSRVDHPSEGAIRQIGLPNAFSGGNRPQTRPAPRLGEDTIEVLRECGFGQDEIDAALRDRIVHGVKPEERQ